MALDWVLRAGVPSAFWIPWLFCTYLALDPSPSDDITYFSDVLLHGLAFCYLTVALGLAHHHRHWLVPAGWMLAYGILLEVVQSFERERTAEFKDVLVDMVGIAVGSGISYWLLPWARGIIAQLSGSVDDGAGTRDLRTRPR